ncbi:histone-like nucleoid-structuring protein Lsr2 [Curtobacterium poinsettiae]|uniref:histone-like nucleoid-structuring protein Lsr2 n=1 Tax=Curtobacterium poinsettiae TaxID=159612 RepID=UPI0040553C5E
MRIGPDLVPEDIPGPAMRSRLGGVPVPELTIVEPVQEDGDVTPWQLCNSLLQSLLLRPSRPERTHVRKVAWGEPLDLRELRTQIRREPTDDVTPPPLIALTLQDRRTDPPVQTDKLSVHAALRGKPGSAHLLLQLRKSSGVAGYGWQRISHHHSVCPTEGSNERSTMRLTGTPMPEWIRPRAKGHLTMAQKVTTHLVDDLTGDTIEDGHGRTVTFSFDGRHYEIDLSDANAETLRETFSDYTAAARKVTGRAGRGSAGGAPKRGNSEELAKIREWANANGHEVSSRGRISQAVRDAYDAAH